MSESAELVSGHGLVEGLGLRACDAQSFEDWMGGKGGSWGRPRQWRNHLGPVTAWHQGDEGGKYRLWIDQPTPADIDADPATKEGIIRLVDDFFQHNARDITARKTTAWGEVTTDANGNASITYRFEATIHDKDKKMMTMVFTFAPNGGLKSLKNQDE